MPSSSIGLNLRASGLCHELDSRCEPLGIACHTLDCGTQLVDLGIEVPGSLEAGVLLARVCLSDLGSIALRKESERGATHVDVATDDPVAACMASQYAGWELKYDDYFAMGSGPMRAAAGREPLFDEIGHRETSDRAVGVLETDRFPPDLVCRDIADKCGIDPGRLTLLVAPTRSPAGTLQIVARSVETALHKLHELGFDLARVVSGRGSAPLAPLADNDLAAIGRTNDAILYGGDVTLEVRGDDASLEAIGPRVPSNASPDYGRPFAEVLARYDNNFYKVDPLLFSAAVIRLENLDSGNHFVFGQLNPDVLALSFGQ